MIAFLFGQLGAKEATKSLYRDLERAASFERPVAWKDIDPAGFDALVLPGGHAEGMKQYLGSGVLQAKINRELTLRRTPTLTFAYDESVERGVRMTKLIDDLASDLPADPEDGDDER